MITYGITEGELPDDVIRAGKQVVKDRFAQLLQNPATVPLVISAIGGIIVWSICHSTLIKPFVLTGVLRNFMASGMNHIPSEGSFGLLDQYSPKFRKLHSEL